MARDCMLNGIVGHIPVNIRRAAIGRKGGILHFF